MSTSTVAEAALAAWDAGLCPIRAATDGTKRPLGQWRDWQATRPDRATVEQWFADGHPALGLVCGDVSGGLEMFEFEGRALPELAHRFGDAIDRAGLGDLWEAILVGYSESTPSGGMHVLWRCSTVEGNLKLAADPTGAVLLETRGEGGFVIVAPSNGTTHPTGNAWQLLNGAFDCIVEISPEERATILEVARSFDLGEPVPVTEVPRSSSSGGAGEAFDASTTTDTVLTAAGFVLASTARNGDRHYTRPGKDPRHGTSATVWARDGRCTLWSSSIDAPREYLDGHHRLTPWRLHVALNHAGDYTAAARQWHAEHPDDPLDQLTAGLVASSAPTIEPSADHVDIDLDGFLDQDDDDYDWLIDGLVERGDRIIVTGEEGRGKSTLLRQIALQVASGLHPFTLEPIEPLQVLYIDCENSPRQARRALRGLRPVAGQRYGGERLRLRVLGHALELARPEILADTMARIDAQHVDLLVIGPLYKLLHDDPVKEMPARQVADALDTLRGVRGSALLIEAHSPYAEGHGKARLLRPYGASLWSRWPEFGLHLGNEGELKHWRGQRDERAWPAALERAQPWPWAPAQGREEVEPWDGPTHCADAVVALLAELGDELSVTKIAQQLRKRGHAYRDQTISTAAHLAMRDGRLNHRIGSRKASLYKLADDTTATFEEPF